MKIKALLVLLVLMSGCESDPREVSDFTSRDATPMEIVTECTVNGCTGGSVEVTVDGFHYEAPQIISVLAGNAGSGQATLTMGTNVCTYRGGSRFRRPLRRRHPGEIERGLLYRLTGCTQWVRGDLVDGDKVELALQSWDDTLPIRASLVVQVY